MQEHWLLCTAYGFFLLACRNSGLNDIPLRLDLHGLHVHEAIAMLEKAIEDWRNSPESMRTGIHLQQSCNTSACYLDQTMCMHRRDSCKHVMPWLSASHCLLLVAVSSTCPDRLPDTLHPGAKCLE